MTALSPIVLFASLAIGAGSDGPWVLVCLGLLVLLVVAPLKWRDAQKRERVLRLSLDSMDVERYGDSPEAIEFERFPATGLLLVASDPLWNFVVTAEAVEVASKPAVPEPLFPERLAPDLALVGASRPLTSEEMSELRRVARRLVPRPRPFQIFCALYAAFGVVATWLGDEPAPLRAFHLVALSGLLLLYVVAYRTQIRDAIRLRRDSKDAVVVRVPQPGEDAEVLPHSGFVWTLNGEPSPLRVVGKAQRY